MNALLPTPEPARAMTLSLGVDINLESQLIVRLVHKPWWDLEYGKAGLRQEQLSVPCLYTLGPHHFHSCLSYFQMPMLHLLLEDLF